jgi:hypothetical protein
LRALLLRCGLCRCRRLLLIIAVLFVPVLLAGEACESRTVALVVLLAIVHEQDLLMRAAGGASFWEHCSLRTQP